VYETYVIEYLTHNDYDIEVSDLYPVGSVIASEEKIRNYFGEPVDNDIYLGWNIMVNDDLTCAIYPQKKGEVELVRARAWTVFSADKDVMSPISFILDSTIEPVETKPKKKSKKNKKESADDSSLADLEEECYDDKD
tara:strand:- start:9921 stop:10331 length:411 start_codon:yes stop_codon:yes gene_type:complete